MIPTYTFRLQGCLSASVSLRPGRARLEGNRRPVGVLPQHRGAPVRWYDLPPLSGVAVFVKAMHRSHVCYPPRCHTAHAQEFCNVAVMERHASEGARCENA